MQEVLLQILLVCDSPMVEGVVTPNPVNSFRFHLEETPQDPRLPGGPALASCFTSALYMLLSAH